MLPPVDRPSIRELLFTAIEVAAADAAFTEFEDSIRGGVGRTHADLLNPDATDKAERRIGGTRWRRDTFFNALPTPDLHALAVIYWTARDTRNSDDRDADRDLRTTMNNVTRNKAGDEEKTRTECVRKLGDVGGSNLVAEFSEALFSEIARAAEDMREEFSDYRTA